MKKKAGFTLSELLIVVAIVGVLVAISIPIFTQQIHKAEVATDWANVRSYYSQLQYDFMETEKVNESYLNLWGGDGLDSIPLNGQTVKLKAGKLWIAPEDNNGGYNLWYCCNMGHTDCILNLPGDSTKTGEGE